LAEEFFPSTYSKKCAGKVQLVFTSPPYPLVKKKKYGNERGKDYSDWLAKYAEALTQLVKKDGSIVLEIGNAWDPGSPTMSTAVIEGLLGFLKKGNLHLCQEFIWYNPARLPSPAQWVTVDRIRVKDAFTRIWWMSPSPRPKADNRKILQPYSKSMQTLLRKKKYNPGKRPSEHRIVRQCADHHSSNCSFSQLPQAA
jgi:site-specific DNA-methyltransferase (cytosine-N4-specific)